LAPHVWLDEVSILVTGSAGLVGSALVRHAGTVGLSRTQLDITDAAAFEAALDRHQPSAIINAAAQAGVDRADEEPEWTAEVNAASPGRMAAIAAARGIRFVHLSTDYVLDDPTQGRLKETSATNPRSTYARTKLDGERAVLQSGGVAVRLQWVYQPGEKGFFNRALQLMKDGQTVRLVTDQVGCPTPAALLAPALIQIARSGPVGLFHLATQGEATAYEWIEAGAEALGVPFLASAASRSDFEGAHRPSRSVLDSGKVASVWGIELPDWRTALQTVAAGGDRVLIGAAP
jgi:dTDP-4-dehydrorhamnose reductase